MNPASLADVRNFWRARGNHPSKRLGQNFLVDANIVRIIVAAAGIEHGDTVLEIGPGLGALTRALAARAKCVLAVEKDRRLYEHLTSDLAELPNLRMVCADALALDYAHVITSPDFKLVSNLPYATGTAMLVNFLRSPRPPAGMTVTLQLEVGRRLAAAPGGGDYGLLGLWAALDYQAEIVKIIAPTCFWPPPLVKSAVVCLRRRPRPALDIMDREFFFELTKQAFGRRRKQLGAVLRGLPLLRDWPDDQKTRLPADAGLDPRARPESLDVVEWGRLANFIQSKFVTTHQGSGFRVECTPTMKLRKTCILPEPRTPNPEP